MGRFLAFVPWAQEGKGVRKTVARWALIFIHECVRALKGAVMLLSSLAANTAKIEACGAGNVGC